MANVKISELTALTPPAAADELVVVDVSATSTKKTTVGEVVGIITGDVEVASNGTATISELPVSKLQDGAARQLLQTDAAGTGVEWTSNVALPGTLGVTGQSTLASAAVSDLTSGRVVLAGVSGELQDSANLTFNGTQLDIGGNVFITGALIFEGSTADNFETTLTVSNPTADQTLTLPNVSGTVVTTGDTGSVTSTMLLDGTIVNADINASAAIVDTKLDTIATAGKVSNSATTATSANTASAIVARDGSGNFSAGTITAALTGAASSNVLKTGDTMTGSLVMDNQQQVRFRETTANGTNYVALQAPASVTADQTITLPAETGTMLVSGNASIVNADVSATAAIAGTKISPDFGNQNIATTGNLDIDTGLLKAVASTNSIGLFGATPATQPAAITNITTTATTGTLPTANGSVTIADAAAPTVSELLEYSVELEAKLEAALAALRTLGVIAT